MHPSELGIRERHPQTTVRGGGQGAAKALNTSPPPTTNVGDKLYHQLAEIHTFTITQLAECAR
jgi:hypothetical protein